MFSSSWAASIYFFLFIFWVWCLHYSVHEFFGCCCAPSIAKTMHVFFMSLIELLNTAAIFLTVSQVLLFHAQSACCVAVGEKTVIKDRPRFSGRFVVLLVLM